MSEELIGIIVGIVIQCLFFAHKLGRIDEKITSLEKKQDKHNNLIFRMSNAEKDIAVMREKIDVGNHRIDDIEDIQNHCKNKNCLN